MGSGLIATLLARGHRVRALARQNSLGRVPDGAIPVVGDALDVESVAAALRSGDTVVHLVGTPHPNPSKAKQFEQIDLVSIRASVAYGSHPTGLCERRTTGADHACVSGSAGGGGKDD